MPSRHNKIRPQHRLMSSCDAPSCTTQSEPDPEDTGKSVAYCADATSNLEGPAVSHQSDDDLWEAPFRRWLAVRAERNESNASFPSVPEDVDPAADYPVDLYTDWCCSSCSQWFPYVKLWAEHGISSKHRKRVPMKMYMSMKKISLYGPTPDCVSCSMLSQMFCGVDTPRDNRQTR